MISDDSLPELSLFREAETLSRFETSLRFSQLVVAGSNERSAVHRWFRFKESFSADLLKTILDDLAPNRKRIRLLDPFCGVGTSLVSAQELSSTGRVIHATGIERNPFIAFVARTKTSWPLMSTDVIRRLPPLLLNTKTQRVLPPPNNSSFKTSRCISRHVTNRLMQIADDIQRDGNGPSHDALLLGVAAAIEPLSRTRKDGRALRLVDKQRVNVAAVLTDRWNGILEDVGLLQRTLRWSPLPRVLLGDGRRPSSCGLRAKSQDIIFTSPPYPNNIDYTEVYKLELWLLGYVKTSEEFLALRRASFRSHPTSGLEDPSASFLRASRRGRIWSLLRPIVDRINDLDEPWRLRILTAYFSDLWTTLEECHRVLCDGGHAVFVVGNSLHGALSTPYLIPTDLLLGAIAERIGFTIERTIAARSLKRRLAGNHFLRESIVVLRKRG